MEELGKFLPGKIEIKFFLNSSDRITAPILVRYIKSLLERDMGLGDIKFRIKGLLYHEFESGALMGVKRGYKVQIKGRFSRRQRAGRFVLMEGAVSRSTLSKNVVYYSDVVVLRYGACSISVWLSGF